MISNGAPPGRLCPSENSLNTFLNMDAERGRHIMWGVAVADTPEGPYVRSEYNPVTNTGHETCLWHYDGGIAALLTRDGYEKRTIQYAEDGINFEIKAHVDEPPEAAGPFRTDTPDAGPLEGIR